MDLDIQSWWGSSTVLRYVRMVRERGPEWAANAKTIHLARELFAPPAAEQSNTVDPAAGKSTDTTTETTATDATGDPTATDATPAPSASDTTDATESSPPADSVGMPSAAPWKSSLVYRSWKASRRFVKMSWLYRWLTAEPDPQLIVIDLRETLSVAPLLARLDRVIRDSIAVLPTSGGARLAYRLRTRFLEQPIRIVSGGVIAAVLVALLGLTVGGSTLGFEIIVLAAILLVAARGTQSTYSWAQLAAMPWYQVLKAVFSPPGPPESFDSDDARSSTE